MGSEEASEGEVDSEGDNIDLDAVLVQLLEVVLSLIGNPRYSALVAHSLEELVHTTLRYMLMTPAQERSWEDDPMQYIQDYEEYSLGLRASGEMILCEIFEHMATEALPPFSRALQRRLDEAEQLRAAGNPHWWRLRESALVALGTISDTLVELHEDGDEMALAQLGPRLHPSALVQELLQVDLQSGCPFLVGRAIWAGARLVPLVPEGLRDPLLQASAAAVVQDAPLPVRLSGCRALSSLLEAVDYQADGLKPLMGPLYTALVGLMHPIDESTVPSLLDTLRALMKVDRGFLAQAEAQLTPVLLNLWGEMYQDPFFTATFVDVVEEIAREPLLAAQLAQRLVPQLLPHIRADSDNPSLVENALDLLAGIAAGPGPSQDKTVARLLHVSTFSPVMELLMRADDAGTLQSCTELLRTQVASGGEELLSWGPADPASMVQALVQGMVRLLGKDMEDSSAVFVGPLLCQCLASFPRQLGPQLPALLAAMAGKLGDPEPMPVLILQLLQVFARLVHLEAHQLLDHLAAIQFPPGSSDPTALHRVLRLWCRYHEDVLGGDYNRRVWVSAMGLLATLPHPALDSILVQGRRMDLATSVGVRTRSKTKASGGEQWTTVAVRVKLVMNLADAAVKEMEARETAAQPGGRRGRGGEDDEDDDDEEEEEEEEASEYVLESPSMALQGQGFLKDGFKLEVREQGPTAGLTPLEIIDLADVMEEEEAEGDTIYLSGSKETDPIANMDILADVRARLQQLAQGNDALKQLLLKELSPAQMQTLAKLTM